MPFKNKNIIELFNLEGKTALVTGCTKGIGKSITLSLAEAGANIIGVSQSLKKGSEVEKKVVGLGKQFTGFSADLSNRDSIYAFINKVKKTNKNISILINNAGTIIRNPAAFHTDKEWDTVLSLNLDAQFILAREFGKEMLDNEYGKIVFICSLLSFQGGIHVPGYAASKGAISSLIKALSNEWASKGINVNGIAPGYISTDNTKSLKNDKVRSKSILDRIPAGRWGDPDDIKGAAVFLSSDASSYVNGTILTVDGGWMGR